MTTKTDKKIRCNAINRKGKQCGNYAIKGKTKCYYHGGATPKGINKGNKHALKTGERELITYETLTEEEKELYEKIDLDTTRLIERGIVLLEIRQRRILKRMNELKDKEVTLMSKEFKTDKQKKELITKGKSVYEELFYLDEVLTKMSNTKLKYIQLLDKAAKTNDKGISDKMELLNHIYKDVID